MLVSGAWHRAVTFVCAVTPSQWVQLGAATIRTHIVVCGMGSRDSTPSVTRKLQKPVLRSWPLKGSRVTYSLPLAWLGHGPQDGGEVLPGLGLRWAGHCAHRTQFLQQRAGQGVPPGWRVGWGWGWGRACAWDTPGWLPSPIEKAWPSATAPCVGRCGPPTPRGQACSPPTPPSQPARAGAGAQMAVWKASSSRACGRESGLAGGAEGVEPGARGARGTRGAVHVGRGMCAWISERRGSRGPCKQEQFPTRPRPSPVPPEPLGLGRARRCGAWGAVRTTPTWPRACRGHRAPAGRPGGSPRAHQAQPHGRALRECSSPVPRKSRHWHPKLR